MNPPYVPRTMRLTAAHVALLPGKIDDPGPMPVEGKTPPDDAFYTKATSDLLAAVPPDGELWLFAFGSLIWNKRFDFVEERSGVAQGWHPEFSLGPDTRYRGNPQAPGYMLSLERDGEGQGMVYRFPRETLAANVERLLRAEPPFPPQWVTVETDKGRVRAFAFTAPDKSIAFTANLTDEAVSVFLARAVGKLGSMAEYVYATVLHLEELGLCDDRLWHIQELVAAQIEADYPDRFPPR
jgi:glutathione-specific gamma-glutamylcyclotransferase